MSFDSRFKKHQDEFERDWERARKFAVVWFVFVFILSIALLSGVVFTVYKVGAFVGIW